MMFNRTTLKKILGLLFYLDLNGVNKSSEDVDKGKSEGE